MYFQCLQSNIVRKDKQIILFCFIFVMFYMALLEVGL